MSPARPASHAPEALGESEAFFEFLQQLSRAARVHRPVLLVGERGTGKELAATRLHFLSPRWSGPLVTLNCAALAPSLLEAELFGHEAGAFTGATRQRRGRFEAAHQGTLFLDEIGLIPMEVQEKILRVVEYGTFERVGSAEPIAVDVRIIGATNADLPALAAAGRFKVDLLDRLSFEVLRLPSLRERQGDIPLLAESFALRMASELEWVEPPEFTPEALRLLEEHDWPGNVRELKNVVERAVYRSEDHRIRTIEFNPFDHATKPPASPRPGNSALGNKDGSVTFVLGKTPLPEAVRQFELDALRRALEQTRFHQAKAAELLGLTYHQFRALYRKHKKRLAQA